MPIDNYAVTRKLPAGHYLIHAGARVAVRATAAGHVVLGCGLDVDGSEVDSAATLLPLVEAEPGKYEALTTVSTQAAVTLPSSATIGLYCYDLRASVMFGETSVSRANIDALEVSRLS